jgi:hypothetical protein
MSAADDWTLLDVGEPPKPTRPRCTDCGTELMRPESLARSRCVECTFIAKNEAAP